MTQTCTVIEQKLVVFYDNQITAVRATDGTVYVPIRPICTSIGISWPAQAERIKRDAVLVEVARNIAITQGEGRETMLGLPLDYLNGWLFGINANRVRPEIREQLQQYQRECYRVLAEAFTVGRLDTTSPALAEFFAQSDDPTSVAYRHAMAVANIARQNLTFEQRLADLERRITTLEAR